MRLSHKRNVQKKLQKRVLAFASNIVQYEQSRQSEVTPVVPAKPVQVKREVTVNLTPKQQQVLDIVSQHSDGINPKSIGLEAGQEDTKAASWATGALKKLLEEGLVEKVQLSGNKVIYKAQ
ncbi:hypothetical protein VA7868_04363 [Vibrio aerogenes CECT 7868]|uniref:MarR family protein n=1 Tax=Vibrio aerogenes CECT 7868 TaxID=1216006 RepID=A0A1M6E008_9VIBR|nr:MarR family transcriptional regulator [Vibrio aerogenes]SHI78598.1 hypothetical protein VA7868_04363 [Vibrio aerogenes CECT 7868]